MIAPTVPAASGPPALPAADGDPSTDRPDPAPSPLAAATHAGSDRARRRTSRLTRAKDGILAVSGSDRERGSLHELVTRSVGYLAGREAIGMVVRLGGVVVTLRAIGPAPYGLFTAASAFVVFVALVAQMGAEVYLIRVPETPTRRMYNEAFTFILVTSVCVTGLSLLLTVPLGGLLRPVGVLAPLRVLLLVIPINVLWAPAQACIEREFGYRRMGILELVGDVVLYGTAVPLALLGWGEWSLVIGYFAWQTWLLLGSLAFSGLRPRPAWSNRTARALLRHGTSYFLMTWASNATELVVALVVGTFAGAAGVGYVNFAQRLVVILNFTKRAVFRVGMVAVSRVRATGVERLARALEEGSFLVIVAAVTPFAAFGLVARWVVPLVFGHAWTTSVPLYVAMAVASCLGILMLVQNTVLLAFGRNLQAAAVTICQLGVVTAASLVLVPRYGAIGFGYASILAVVATAVSHRYAARVAPMRYGRLVVALVALLPPVFAPLLPFPISLATVVPVVILVLLPSTRREAQVVVGVVRTTLAKRTQTAPTGPGEPSPTAGGTAAATARRPGTGSAPGAPGAVPTVTPPATGSPAPRTIVPGRSADPTSPEVGAGMPLGLPDADVRPGVGRLGAPGPTPLLGPATPAVAPARAPAPVAPVPAPASELEPYWAIPPDAVTGATSLDVMLARAGRLLGGARRSGWPVLLAAFELSPSEPGGRVAPAMTQAVLDALRAELRFDDPIAHAGPATFVVATALPPGAAEGAEVAGRLAAGVAARLEHPEGQGLDFGWSCVVTTEGSADEVDDLLRMALGELHAVA